MGLSQTSPIPRSPDGDNKGHNNIPHLSLYHDLPVVNAEVVNIYSYQNGYNGPNPEIERYFSLGDPVPARSQAAGGGAACS